MADETPPQCILDSFDTRSFIAISLTLSMIALTFVLALKGPESDAFKILLGAMLTVGFASAIGWYFNSSSSSEKKDVTQARVAEKLAEKVTPSPSTMLPAAIIAAAEAAAPPAAAAAAPPAAELAAPPAAEEAVREEFERRENKKE